MNKCEYCSKDHQEWLVCDGYIKYLESKDSKQRCCAHKDLPCECDKIKGNEPGAENG